MKNNSLRKAMIIEFYSQTLVQTPKSSLKSYLYGMFELRKFIALIAIEDDLMQVFFDKAETAGLEPTFDVYHVMNGDETPKPEEIKILEEVFKSYVIGSKYEVAYQTADVDFPKRLAEKNKRRSNKIF